jgi:hypothetical protein
MADCAGNTDVEACVARLEATGIPAPDFGR